VKRIRKNSTNTR